MKEYTLFWFRRDLRLEDNHGLYKALQGKSKVIPIFIFDPSIIQKYLTSSPRTESKMARCKPNAISNYAASSFFQIALAYFHNINDLSEHAQSAYYDPPA